jgi:HEAT repeat protein
VELVRDALAAAIGAIRDEKLLRMFVDQARREKREPGKPSEMVVLVLRAIAYSAHPKLYPDVHPWLRDSEQEVLLAAIAAAGRVGDDRALEALLGYLRHADFVVAIAAAEALGHLGSDAAIDPLIGRLQDPDYRVRYAAAQALARLRCEDVVEPLIRCLENSGDWLTKELAAILQDLLTGAGGWRGWWEKNKRGFRVWFEEDHAK